MRTSSETSPDVRTVAAGRYTATMIAAEADAGRGPGAQAAGNGRRPRLLPKAPPWLGASPRLAAAAVALVTVAAGSTFATTTAHAHLAAAPVALTTVAAHAAVPPSTAATSTRKGVSTWSFAGDTKALKESGASWFYNWAPAPDGIAAPAGAHFVPMMWGAASVNTATLSKVRHEGKILLGFNEPDQRGQANMTVKQALSLWPKLMATGMTLGSPAVSYGAATPGGWLDQFMAGAKARHDRVSFIALHWYGGDFVTSQAVQQLKSYLQATHARYHQSIWLTEFALANFSGSGPEFPTEAKQAAFLTAATKMLDGLSYVQRYAWFALPTSPGSGTTGLFNPGPTVTEVGRAFERAR
jgi:Glycosyl hydrolase catalytic core